MRNYEAEHAEIVEHDVAMVMKGGELVEAECDDGPGNDGTSNDGLGDDGLGDDGPGIGGGDV